MKEEKEDFQELEQGGAMVLVSFIMAILYFLYKAFAGAYHLLELLIQKP